MSYLTGHWAFDPVAILVVAVVAWHEAGLARLARHSPADLARQRRLRSLYFYGGLAVLLLAVESSLEYWSIRYFFVHMIQHLLLMFAAPMLVVVGAPWQALRAGLPGRPGKGGPGRAAAARPVRAAGRFVLRPWIAVIIFNVVMLVWHLPGPLDLATRNQAVRIWLMHGSFFAAGVLFWLQFLPSPPFLIQLSRAGQAVALLATNVQMWFLAMALGILSPASWYPVYDHVPGVTLPPFPDQQLGAAILWICGDFWAVPVMIYVIRRMLAEEGDVGRAVDKILGRGARGARWDGSPARPGAVGSGSPTPGGDGAYPP